MGTTLTINGVGYPFPAVKEKPWAQQIINWATAATNGLLQKSGGSFTLLADIDFGATYGLKSAYFLTRTANPASAGQVRLAHGDVVSFRNNANSADLDLAVNVSDQLTFKGVVLAAASGDVEGPAGATDGAVCAFDGVTGKLIKEVTVKARGVFTCGRSDSSFDAADDYYLSVGRPNGEANPPYEMHRDGSVIGFGIYLTMSGSPTGQIDWELHVNGTPVVTLATESFTLSGTTYYNTGTIASGTYSFSAGDTVAIFHKTVSASAASTLAVDAYLEVEFDT